MRELVPEAADLDVEVFLLPNLGAVNVRHPRAPRGAASPRRRGSTRRPRGSASGCGRGTCRSRTGCCERPESTARAQPARSEALRETAREFVRREVAPHLQDWEDAGSIPRELHAKAARAGLLGVSFPEDVGGEGGDLADTVALQEAFFEAGASSGLMAGLFTGGIALPHIARLRQRRT